jgi:TolA-binding protein
MQQQTQQMQQQTQEQMNQMQEQTQQMQQQTQQMQQQTQQMQQQLQEVSAGIQLLNQEAERTRNRVCVRTNDDEITPMRRQDDGAYPLDHGVWYPNDLMAIWSATHANLDVLLEFYGLTTVGNVDLKRRRLRTFLGISL